MKDIKAIKNIFVMLLVLLAGVCFFVTLGNDYSMFIGQGEFMYFNDGWSYNVDDGPVQNISAIPCKIESLRGETVTITNTLPEYKDESLKFCILSYYQDISVYIDDRLIFTDKCNEIRSFGKTDGVNWIFVPLKSDYAGRKISVRITSEFDTYSGRIENIYIGTQIGVIRKIFTEFGFPFFVGIILLIAGVIFLIIYFIGRYSKLVWYNYLYLGYFTVGIALWLICESRIPQLIFSYTQLFHVINHAIIMLIPIPILLYTNDVEQNRYGREFNLMCWIFIVNFIAQIALYATNTCDFIDLSWITHILIAMIFITALISLFVCYHETHVHSIKNYFEGLLVMFMFYLAEAASYYFMVYESIGAYVSIGVVFYVIILSHGSTVDKLEKEREKIVAVSQNQAKTNFLARMSHEIRTPMNSIIGMNDMILNENINEDVRKYAINIKNSANVMMNLLSDVLDFSKIESGKMEIVSVNYKLFDLLRDIIGIIGISARNKNLDFIYEIDEGIPSGYVGDEIRIKQVLLNILNNAVKYTEKGYVKLSFHYEYTGFMAWFIVSVEDTGIGIREEELGKIFDNFERLDSEKNRRVEGAGLGLTITKQILELMGGSIEIKSEYGKGSTFTVRIPQKIVNREPMEPLTEENLIKNSSQKSIIEGKYSGKRILAVDDNEVNLQVVAGLLKSSKARIDGVLSGDKCLTAMARYHYDLVLMDHRMPGMDGVETLKYIRGNPVNHDIPVIALTANAVEGAREDFLAEGFDDYISKPISAKKFYAMLDKYLS